MSTTAIRVSRQSMRIMATSDAMTVTTLPRMLVTVFVSTPETPPTSFCSRDWITPVFVRVKNPSSIACRCSKSRTRRSPVTLLPTVDVSQVCATPSTAERRKRPIMPPTSHPSSDSCGPPPSTGKSASSKMRCTSRGGMTAMPAPTTTRTPVTAMRQRYGRNSAITRPPSPLMRGASAFMRRCAASSTPRKPPPRPPIPPPMLMSPA
jgi:hypothetical protein